MISGVHTEVVLSASYAIFLTTVAVGLELLARHSHKRSERYRNSGFTYFRDRDAWECPAGQQLLRQETHYERRIIHYRPRAEACNRCALKNNCTDSNEGRVLKESPGFVDRIGTPPLLPRNIDSLAPVGRDYSVG
jgi:hypothetical protein